MVDPCGGAHKHGLLECFGQFKGLFDHLLGLGHTGGLQHGKAAELGIVTVVLLVLAGKHGRIISGQHHHASGDTDIGEGHQRVGGHIEAHMLHHAKGPQTELAAAAATSRETFSLVLYSK